MKSEFRFFARVDIAPRANDFDWVAILVLNQMLLIRGLSAGMQFVVFGAAIIVGMLISGDRIASLLGRLLRPRASPTRVAPALDQDMS